MAPPNSEFLDYILELLEPLSGIRSGRMFGGYAVYKNDVPIGLIFQDVLYYKVDDSNRSDYKVAGSKPFVYTARGKEVVVSNWEVPVDVLEDPEQFLRWTNKAYKAALATKKKKK